MKNLKKTLAVVLAFAMVLSMGFSAFAYTDVTAGTKVAEAVGILSNLNIFTGFEDGTFKPNDTVTRAQMAAIICRTLGYEDQATASTGTTNFYDVPASHWASGYINVAESLQIVNGYGNGAFGPEDQVTYEQAIKMIVVALGYELDAQAKGGWSTGYLAVAAREGITKNSNGVVGAPATRGTIAVLVYNALEVPLMDQDVWTPSGKEDEYTKLAETILSRYLDVTKIEAVVVGVPYATFADTGYTADADLKVTFDDEGAKYYGFNDNNVYKALDYTATEDFDFDATYVPEINNMAGKKVVAYVGNEEDEELGARAVYAVAEKQGANKVTVLSGTQLTANDDDDLVIEYREVGSKSKKTIDLAGAITPVINFGTVTEGVTAVSNTAELAALVEEGGIITLISNDANSKIDKIYITKYSAEAVIEEVSEEDGLISFKSFAETDELLDIDTEDEDVLYVVIKDGAIATVADIAANDTVSVVGDDDEPLHESFNLYYVSSKTVTGKVDEHSTSDVTIAGEDYVWSPLSAYESSEDLAKKEGIFFLNVDGQIAYADATADKNFGIVIAAGTEGRKNMIEVVLADGTSAIYELADKAKFGEASTDDAVLTALEALLGEESNGWDAAAEDEITGLVFNITIKDGKVKELAREAAVEGATNVTGRAYDEENMEYGALSFNDSTVVISLADIEDGVAVEAGDIKVGKVADFFVDGEGNDFHLWAYDYDNNDVAGLVIGTGLTSAIAQDSAAIIVTGYKEKLIDDEDAFVINGFQDGKAVSYTILDEDVATDAEVTDFAKGNIILVGATNAEGMITDYEVLYTREGGLKVDIADKEDEYYYFGTLDESQEPTASKFYLEDVVDVTYTGDGEDNDYVELDGVTMRNAARYTLVDFSKVDDIEKDDIEVSKKSKGTGLFSRYTDKYDYKVFVRYFDDTQVEVIVFRDAPEAEEVEEE